MKRLVTLIITLIIAAAAQAQSPQLLTRGQAGAELEVRDVKASTDGSVSGTVFNTTNTVIKDVKLLVKHTWYWNDERHPGEDSPGRSEYFSVPGEVAPGASAPFSFSPSSPLPQRSDGTFKSTVTVQSFAQVGE